MAAITFERALLLATSPSPKPTLDVKLCFDALVSADVETGAALSEVKKHLTEINEGTATGALVLGALRAAKPAAVGAWVALIAPKARIVAAEVLADAYLALDAWVIDWNRRQIRRVA